MSYASHAGRARTSASSPNAHAICDRCGFRYNFTDLQWQYDWRGASIMNIRVLVCRTCLDTPQEQLRAIVVPADPTPIINARVQDFSLASDDSRSLSAPTVYDAATGIPIPNTNIRVTQTGAIRSTQPVGPVRLNSEAPGLQQGAVMPLNGAVAYGVHLPLLSVTANGTTVVTATCSAPHGLATGSQISAEGLSSKHANGFFSIIVTTATAFAYASNVNIPAGSLLTGTANIITCTVGLPRNFAEIPQSGI